MDTLREHTQTASSHLNFVWMELTNRCNLHCIHCYSESSPCSGNKDLLTEQDYSRLIKEVRELGCENLQFIGGEPTLNRSLPCLIQKAAYLGFPFIEVFTNLVRLPESLVQTFVDFNVAVATSFYSYHPDTHNSITTHKGSFKKTVRNIRRVLDAGLRLRAGIIIMDQNRHQVAETWTFLRDLGVENIGSDHVRGVGRAESTKKFEMGELCGSCAGSLLSIAPDGSVAPCNMSRNWSVGSVLSNTLTEIATSEELAELRAKIGKEVRKREKGLLQAICPPKTCAPYSSCCPSTQSCAPCAPNGCSPCYPKG